MGKLFRGLFFLVILVIAGLIFAPNFIPADVYKPRVQQAVSEALGREVTMAGDIRFQFFPTVDVVVEDVSVANVPNGKAPVFAQMDEMAVGLDVSSLLSGAIGVDRFTLTRPQIYLEVDSKGRSNWEFEGLEDDSASKQGSASDPSGDQNDDGFAINTITFGDIRLIDGSVSYRTPNGEEVFSDINLALGMTSLDEPLRVDGNMGYKDKPVNVALVLDRPRFMTEGGESQVGLELDSAYGKGSFQGSVTQGADQNISLTGQTDMNILSVGQLMDDLTGEKNGLDNLKALTLSGALNGNAEKATFSKVSVKLNDMSGAGNLFLNLANKRPYLSGALALNRLDFNDLMGTSSAQGAGGNARDGQSAGAQSSNPSSGWDATPMDLSALRSFNADLDITADKLFFQELRFGKSDVALKLRGGVLTTNLKQIALYQGTGSGILTLDARQNVTQISSQFTLNNLATLPFLTDALGLDRIEGLGSFSYDVTTRGRSQKQWVGNLQGISQLKVIDGAWRGVNLADMARTLQTFLGSSSANEGAGQANVGNNEKTDFAELGGTFQIKNGVVQNTDLSLLNPFIRVAGKGSINLLQQNVSFRLKPNFVKSAIGQGGDAALKGVSVPIVVQGPWTDISYQADFASIIGEALLPGQGIEEPEDLLKGVLENALGIGQPDEQPAERAETEEQKALTKEERRKQRQLERQKQRAAEKEAQQKAQEEAASKEEVKPEDLLRDFLKEALTKPKEGAE